MREQNFLRLTPRQKEILALVAKGYTNKAIASRLRISPKTVDAHLSNIYRILQVSNRTEAARLFLIFSKSRRWEETKKSF